MPTTLPVKTVAEYVALAKSKPGTLNYSHPGKGSTGHLSFELFKRLAGIEVTGIGYRGYPQMVPDIASGLINSTFLSANQVLAQVQSGAIRIIGAINDGRSKYLPEVPTMAEQGFAEAQVTPWFGIVTPAATPQPVVARISKALEAALATTEGPAEARRGRLRAQKRAAWGLRRHHQVRRCGVGQRGQGGRDHRRLTAEALGAQNPGILSRRPTPPGQNPGLGQPAPDGVTPQCRSGAPPGPVRPAWPPLTACSPRPE